MSVPSLIRRIIGSLDLLLLIALTHLDSEGVLGEIVNQGWFVWTEGGSMPVDETLQVRLCARVTGAISQPVPFF